MRVSPIHNFASPIAPANQIQSTQTSLTRKTDSLAYRIFHSPLFWTSVIVATITVYTQFFIEPIYGYPLSLAACVALGAVTGFVFVDVLGDEVIYKSWFELSLLCVRIQAAFTRFAHRYLLYEIQER